MLPLFTICFAIASPQTLPKGPYLRSESVLVRWADTKEVLIQKRADMVRPIASITKLLSALVLEDVWVQNSSTTVAILDQDKDRLKWSRSRLRVGERYTFDDLYSAALGASDNRAMYALVRTTGTPRDSFVMDMNRRAQQLGMRSSHFMDPAGIHPGNVSTARDLCSLLEAAASKSEIKKRTTNGVIQIQSIGRGPRVLANPNRLARQAHWQVLVGKTGYTVEAGRTLVLRVLMDQRPLDMVFLGAREMMSVFGDAARVRQWLQNRILGPTSATPSREEEVPLLPDMNSSEDG